MFREFTICSETVLYVQRLYYMFRDCTICLETVLYVKRLYYMVRDRTICLETVLYVQRLFCMFRDCTICLETVLYVQRLFCMFRDCTVCLETVLYVQRLYCMYVQRLYCMYVQRLLLYVEEPVRRTKSYEFLYKIILILVFYSKKDTSSQSSTSNILNGAENFPQTLLSNPFIFVEDFSYFILFIMLYKISDIYNIRLQKYKDQKITYTALSFIIER